MQHHIQIILGTSLKTCTLTVVHVLNITVTIQVNVNIKCEFYRCERETS